MIRKLCKYSLLVIFAFSLSSCSEVQLGAHMMKSLAHTDKQGVFKVGNPYTVNGKRYYPQESYSYDETGIASWYGDQFHGKPTANGEIFDKYELTAAHKTLQLPSLVKVTNLENGKSLILRVNDRGPFKRGRIIDVSEKAAELLGFKNDGVAKVRVQVLKRESLAIAQAAKRGMDTRGIEQEMNRGNRMPSLLASNETASDAYRASPKPASNITRPYQPVNTYTHQASANINNPHYNRDYQSIKQEYLHPPDNSFSAPQQISAYDNVPVNNSELPGHIKNGNFIPDPVVTYEAVSPSNIFVQTGSFSSRENAIKFAQSLIRSGMAGNHQPDIYPTGINGKVFYRVRYGPFENIVLADTVLEELMRSRLSDAIIVVE